VVVLLSGTTAWAQAARQGERQEPAVEPPPSEQTINILQAMSEAFRRVASRVKPAVVQIEATVGPDETDQPQRRPQIDPRQLPEPFREFFEEFDGLPQRPTPQYGRGSGVIIDAEQGFILTNSHVVGGDEQRSAQQRSTRRKSDPKRVRLDVTLDNGRKVQAVIVGQDPKTDIALIRIREADLEHLKASGVKLQALPIGDSSKVEVGDWVLAIGAPFGMAQSVTQGIISATGRSNVGIVDIEDFIQTDAAINPGNSGGPLVNMRGELIGINTAIATSGLTRGYMGIGFAIPSEMVMQVLPDLKEGREIVRGYLGVAIIGLDQRPGLARTFGLEEDRGILIEEIRPNSPASKAGLKPEDVILAVGDRQIQTVNELQNLVARTRPGETLDLIVWRDNKKITIPVEIEKQPEDFYTTRTWQRNGRAPEGEDESQGTAIESVGMTVARMTPELAKRYGWEYDEVKNQIVVTEVDPLGEAGALRISEGDIIVSVQGEAVKSPVALRKALSSEALKSGVRLRVRTPQGTRTLLLEVAP
ncbi:MAG TPA: trypsin-like peptidase domain-containing protein, partial [Phycisphaerae bacterium]|nr:trypsin-like peptidase domain-containing protein [Phycisphaerae bacterium]